MPTEIITWFDFAQLNDGKGSTLAEFHEQLARFEKTRLVFICAMFNWLLGSTDGSGARRETHDWIVRALFEPQLQPLLTLPKRICIHRLQLLFTIKEALTRCPDSGLDPFNQMNAGQVGRLLLMANDHLSFQPPTPYDTESKLWNALAQLLPAHEYSGWNRIENTLARSHVVFMQIVPELRNHPDYVDVRASFANRTSLSMPQFWALAFGVMAYYHSHAKPEEIWNDPNKFAVDETYFKNTTLAGSTAGNFWSAFCTAIEKPAEEISPQSRGPLDFTAFRARPLFQWGAGRFPVDLLLLAENMEAACFWNAHAACSKPEQDRLFRFWGRVFEDYIILLLKTSAEPKLNRVIDHPHFTDGTEFCDALILSGPDAVLIECKASVFRADAKYGNDPERLRAEVEPKLIVEKKGLPQLASGITRAFGRHSQVSVQGDIDLSRISRVFPLVLCRDDLGAALAINAILARRFKRLLDRKAVRPVVTPLFCTSQASFEILAGYLGRVSLASILDARYRSDPNLLSTFLAADNQITDQLPRETPALLRDAWRSMSDGFLPELFNAGT